MKVILYSPQLPGGQYHLRSKYHWRSQQNSPKGAYNGKTPMRLHRSFSGGGRWICPPAGGPFRGSGVPPARHSLPLPFKSTVPEYRYQSKNTIRFRMVFCLSLHYKKIGWFWRVKERCKLDFTHSFSVRIANTSGRLKISFFRNNG